MATGVPVTARLSRTRAMQVGGPSGEDELGAPTLRTQDNAATRPPIYIYNICELSHVRNQPPEFATLTIEPCPKGQKFSVKPFPGLVNERYVKPGTAEYYYNQVDGRKYATSLLNPDCMPGTDWRSQLNEGTTGNNDMTGMNMNAFGVFWSELKPDDPQLDAQEGKLGNISPMMHFAMDYFGLSAAWHMSTRHKVECPNCGDLILEGLAYHRNASGDICILDRDRYEASVISVKQQKETESVPTQAKEVRPRTKAAR